MSTDAAPSSVAIFASSYAPHLGGVEELVRQLARVYRGRGIETIVVTNRWPRDLPAHEAIDGTPVYRFPFRSPEGSVKARISYATTSGQIRRSVRDLLREHEVDLVHVQCVSMNGVYARDAARRLGLPLVVTAQGERTMDATGIYARSPMHNRVLAELLDEADIVTACSADVLRDLEQWHGRRLSNGHVVHNGVALGDFAGITPDEGGTRGNYVLALGRLVPQKGFAMLIRAYAQAFPSDAEAAPSLVIAGEGPEAAELESIARALAVGSRVELVGGAARDRVMALLDRAVCVALPSQIEPFGIVGLEAMAAGRALVASNTGGIPEYVRHDVNGILVEPDDESGWANALRTVANDQSRRVQLAMAGKETSRDFDWSAIGQQYLNLYAAARGGQVRPRTSR